MFVRTAAMRVLAGLARLSPTKTVRVVISPARLNVLRWSTIPSNVNWFARKREIVEIIFAMNRVALIETHQFQQITLVTSTAPKCSTVANTSVDSLVILAFAKNVQSFIVSLNRVLVEEPLLDLPSYVALQLLNARIFVISRWHVVIFARIIATMVLANVLRMLQSLVDVEKNKSEPHVEGRPCA